MASSQAAVAAAAAAAARDEYRRPLQQLLRKAGLLSMLEAGAFNALLDHAVGCEGRPDDLEPVLDALLADAGDGIVTAAQVRSAVHALGGEPATVQALHVISAFDVPRVVYDPVAKRLLTEVGGGADVGGGAGAGAGGGAAAKAASTHAAGSTAPGHLSSSLLPDASYKHRVYLDRYHLLYQRLRRNKRFQPRTALAVAGVRVPGGGKGSGRRDQHDDNDDDPSTTQNQHQHVALTEIMGLKGCVGERHIVMGLLSTSEEGNFLLEDGGAAVPLDLSRATVASGLVTENCVVVAEGEMGVDGAFHAAAAGFPSCEPRSALPATAQALDFFGGPTMTPEDRGAAAAAERDARAAAADGLDVGGHRLVFLTDVALDRPGTLESLHTIFSGFSQAAGAGAGGDDEDGDGNASNVPAAFVLMGDFWAGGSGAAVDDAAATGGGAADGWVGGGAGGAGGVGGACGGGGNGRDQGGGVTADFLALREAFGGLASLIDQYPRLRDHSQFVFVPGPNDPGLGDILPAAPLAPYFTSELRRVLGARAVFATNPCRLRYHGREVVVFRHDLMAAMRRRVLVPPAGLEDLELHQGYLRGGGGGGDKHNAGGTQQAASSDDSAVRRALFAHLALTLMQQSHLCPLPLVAQPVHWRHDQALRLYPLPHAVVLADGTAPQAAFRHEGCTVFCPGSLRDREFSAYLPFGGGAFGLEAATAGDDDVEPSVLPGGPGAEGEARRREAKLRAQQEAEAARWAAKAAEEAAAAVAAAAEAPMDWLASGGGARGGGGGGAGGGEDEDAAAAEDGAAEADDAAEAAASDEAAELDEEAEEAGDDPEDEEMPAEPTAAEDEEMAAEARLPDEAGGGGEGEDGGEGAAAGFGSPVAAAAAAAAAPGVGGSSEEEEAEDDEAARPVSGGGEDEEW